MRQATADDIPALVDMGRRFHEAKQELYEFNSDHTAMFFAGIIQTGVVLICDDGFLAGSAMGAPSNQSYRTAYEIFWWSEGRSGLRLKKAFEAWAKKAGCQDVKFSHPADEDAVNRLLKRDGYAPSEMVLRKEI